MAATGFCEYSQVLSYNPFSEPIAETSFFVEYGLTIVGPPAEVPNGRMDTAVFVRVDLGDTLTTVQTKIRQACIDFAMNNGNVPLNGRDLIIPAYQKG